LGRYGVRVNAIAPAAATRLTESFTADRTEPPPDEWSPINPANIAPFVAYLATEDCPIHGRIFLVSGGQVHLLQPFAIIDKIEKDGLWTIGELKKQAARLAEVPFHLNNPYEGQMG
jgi:hypothetical protein